MTTSRQRRKQKSGGSGSARSKRAVQKRIRRAPPIQAPAAIRENWDPKATVRQNYRNLGLTGDLSMRDSGGAEDSHRLASVAQPGTFSRKAKGKAATGLAKIERDEEGNIIVIDEPSLQRAQTAWGPALNSEDEGELEAEQEIDESASAPVGGRSKASEVVGALESAAETVKPVQRFTSDQEQAWLHRLVSKHGTDVEAMSRDRADNLWQKTAGEIRRAIKKAGGFPALGAA